MNPRPRRTPLRTSLPGRVARGFALALLLLAACLGRAVAADAAATLVHILDYVAVDYAEAVADGQVRNDDEFKEMNEFAAQAQTLLASLPEHAARPALQADAAALAQRVAAKAPAAEIRQRAGDLRRAVIRAWGLVVAPKEAPDLRAGAALYAAHCAGCHGADGRGDGAAGRALEPAPSNFHDAARMRQRSVHGLHDTITLGVAGTGMQAFGGLSEAARWALAFHVANLGADPALRERGAALWRAGQGRQAFEDLGPVATLSADEVRQRFGADAVAIQAHLRAEPAALAALKPSPLAFAQARLDASLDAYRRGERARASELAIEAYLEGFELAEAGLANVDAPLVKRIERAMMDLRALLQAGAPVERVERQALAVRTLLADARERLSASELSPATTFASALVILLREGAEAILVVAALLAFAGRAGRSDARRWIHLGWIAALALGGATWAVSSHLIAISGAEREITEGVTALIAAAMLLYVGWWLHSKSHSAAWQQFIGQQVGAALSGGTLWTLALVSFLAVYREAFETVLFVQALAAQAGPAGSAWMLGGLAAAALLLAAFGWAILRASVRLPIGLFFSASGIVLLVLAVIFTGQGVAALQEAGRIGADSVAFVSVPMLGVHPTLQSLGAQVAVALLVVLLYGVTARQRRRGGAAVRAD